jgi:predicted permease
MKNKSARLIDEILLYTAVTILIVRSFVKRNGSNELADILSVIIIVLGTAIIVFKLIYWLFPKWFANKPTQEEIEENSLGRKINT